MTKLTIAQFWGLAAASDIVSHRFKGLIWDWKYGLPWTRATRGADKLLRVAKYLLKQMQEGL